VAQYLDWNLDTTINSPLSEHFLIAHAYPLKYRLYLTTPPLSHTCTVFSMAASLEPFPLFIDSAPPEAANYFSSTMTSSLHLLASSSPLPSSRTRKPRVSVPAKLSNYVRLRYYQYEVTFGLYMMTPGERVLLNCVFLTVLSGILCALYFALGPLLTRTACRLVYYITGSFTPAGELCTQ
jgi:Small subunit of serine palmitoyltransferase-like